MEVKLEVDSLLKAGTVVQDAMVALQVGLTADPAAISNQSMHFRKQRTPTQYCTILLSSYFLLQNQQQVPQQCGHTLIYHTSLRLVLHTLHCEG